ncbi:MAG TPA: imidazole glycerol phosphate synthase subunit HisF [Gemmatimonadaceae bacterium]|nr:imidazole glycerol phosphate synthase subunit HisF [Gemmatimonadaceae bacterium]
MTLRKRVIVCLDVSGDRVVKGVQFAGLRDVGDPATLAARYEAAGADEVVFLDVSATIDRRDTLLDCVRRTAEALFIPLTVGGGIRSVDDASRALRAGADKIGVNSAAVVRPALLTELSARFGAQCVVASIDAKRAGPRWAVFVRGGRVPTGRDALEWARECVARGAGEILLTSIDRDGTRTGYDLALTHAVASCVSVPVIASGGAGSPDDVRRVLTETGADAALVAGILHDGGATVFGIKAALASGNVCIRGAA